MKKVFAVTRDRGENLFLGWSYVRVGINLSVWVVQGYTDLLSTILKRKNGAYTRHAHDRICAVGKCLENGANSSFTLASQRAFVLWRENHDLAAPD